MIRPSHLTRGLDAAPADAVYVTSSEAAQLLGVSQTVVNRRVRDGSLRSLSLGGALRRIEARAVRPDAPRVPREVPNPIPLGWLASLWRVHPHVLGRLGRAGRLPLQLRLGVLSMRRGDFLVFVQAHTTGVPCLAGTFARSA